MSTIYVVGPDGDVVQREVSFEIGEDEAYKTNLKALVDAWNKEFLRGSQVLDEYNQTLKQQLVRHTEEMHDSRLRAVERYENIFANALQHSIERQGATQGAMVNNMMFDTQKVAESEIESAMAAGAQSNQVAQSVVTGEMVEALKTLVEVLKKVE